jgi:phenylacetyl-CoA:acceptor oxidoreductase subunit 2
MKSARQKTAGKSITPRQQQNWDWRAASNFICGGSGSGLLILSVFAAVAGADVRPAIVLALVLVATGLTCVWFEIGRPWRALNVYRHIQTSWMTREAVVALPLFLCGALAFYTQHIVWQAASAVCGAAFLYSQARILVNNKGIPAWRHPRCLLLMASTGLAEGAGFLALAATLAPPPQPVATLAAAVIALSVLRIVAWRAYLAALRHDGAPSGSLKALAGIDARIVFGSGAGAIVFAAAAAANLPGAVLWLAAAGALAAGGGWMLKYTLILRAAFNQGLAIGHLPVRGRGVSGPPVKPGWGGLG